MVGRPPRLHDDRSRRSSSLAIRTDVHGKGAAASRHHAVRSASLSSEGTSPDDHDGHDGHGHTHLSASSAANTDTLSSSGLSANSTARTSAMDDDPSSSSSPTSPSPHAHPTLTLLELVSNTAGASALPDSFDFSVSRRGNFVAVYSASNIWLVKTAQLPRLWARTLQVRRKPVAIDITEDGFLLAVLSRPEQVDLYEIHGEQGSHIRKRRSVMLVHEASSVALSPDGLILITGNRFGIEVVAVGPDAPETARRTLSGPVGETLEFSDDGRTLLVTGFARKPCSSFVFVLPGLYDGPLNEEGVPVPASPEALWTGSMLFPETAKIARQATLLPDADTGQVNELFAFNADEDTWGVYDITSQRFTQRKMFLPDQQRWTRSEFLDDAMPAVSPDADLAAVALRMRGTTSIWIYQVPEWDFKSTSKSDLSPILPCFCIPILQDGSNVYQEICALRWVKISTKVQRLVAVGNTSLEIPGDGVPGVSSGSKGIVIVLDFDKTKPASSPAPTPTKTEYDLDPLCPGELLPEGSIDFEREVELVRTRTMAQRRAQDRASERRNSRGSAPGRARTTANRERPTSIRQAPAQPPANVRDDEVELTLEEAQAAFEAPYHNQQPRSQVSLARAATVAAVSPANRRHLRALPFRPLEYRRADGLREFPHESDADNWIPPPPAYTTTAEAAQSVSLSHPNAPPVPRIPQTASGAPPVPPLPATVNPSQMIAHNPYQNRGQSVSSTDLTSAPPHVAGRRPSLLHPSTFPSPLAGAPGRRRSSVTQSPSQQAPTTHNTPPVPPIDQSAYQAASSILSTRRPSSRSRRLIESSVDFRPPPVIDPVTGRRGSAPDAGIHRRPVPRAGASPNRVSMPMTHHTMPRPQQNNARRAMLPRLSTMGDSMGRREPLSAPPRTNSGNVRIASREKEKSPKKKIGCIVM